MQKCKCLFVFIRNARGEIIALYLLMPDRMMANRDGDGQLYYEYKMSTDDAYTLKGLTVRLQSHDVLHIPGLGFDGLVEYSTIAMEKNAIGMAIACGLRMQESLRQMKLRRMEVSDETEILELDKESG